MSNVFKYGSIALALIAFGLTSTKNNSSKHKMNSVIIEGVKELQPVEFRVIPDRIEAGTFMVAATDSGVGGSATTEGSP